MSAQGDFDVWRIVPPEEKFEIMAKAQSKGMLACVITVIISSTIAVGFKMSWIMWGSLIICPFIFQFAAGKAWRTLRPKTMLEYLAARSASRRYAYTTSKAKDLTPNLIFRGNMEEVFGNDQIQEAMEAMIDNTKDAEVWVTLFGDAVVLISEKLGGAELKFAHVLDDKLSVTSRAPNGSDYSAGKELYFEARDKDGTKKRSFKLTSKYPAALVVFEKKLKTLKANLAASPVANAAEFAGAADELAAEDDDKFNNLFSF